jgi:hypothetical protein
MGLGVLEPSGSPAVPGTVLILDEPAAAAAVAPAARNPNLKYDRTGTIILVPQPSDDPNDPLVRLLNCRKRKSNGARTGRCGGAT